MTGLMKRIFRRREPGQSPRRGVASVLRGRARGQRLPGYRRMPSFGIPRFGRRLPWRGEPIAPDPSTQATGVVGEPPPPSFKDRGRLRRRLRYLRRARELGFRDIGGLVFDMRRFARNRPDLLDAKLEALLAVDQELRALERVLDDRRPFHELREPGISSCPRCGALHSSEANFCPQCGLQLGGPRVMGEVGGAIAAPPQPPRPPTAPGTARPSDGGAPEWAWPAPAADQPTPPSGAAPDPPTEQLTVAYVPVLHPETDDHAGEDAAEQAPPDQPPPAEPQEAAPATGDASEPAEPPAAAGAEGTASSRPKKRSPPRASGGS